MLPFNKKKKGIHLTIPQESELLELALMYLAVAPYDFLPFSHTSSYIAMRNKMSQGSFVRKIMYDDEVVGFVIATTVLPFHLDTKCLVQEYYYCNQKGFKAARILVHVHKELIALAERSRLKIVMSSCNTLYKSSNLVDILGKFGWSVMGYTAIWRTKYHENPSKDKGGNLKDVES
jgi:hypothetical protein